MKNQNQLKALNPFSGGFINGFLTFCIMLGFGFTGLQAQNEVLPANFYNLVNGEPTNEITVAPGESFTWIIGMSSEGGMDGVTITSEFDTNLLQEDDETITDLIGANLIFGVQSIVNNETGYITFTKTAIGTSITGSFDVMELVFTVNADAPNGTTVLAHELDPAVVLRSNIVYIGNEILADEDAPSLTVNIQGPADCPELGLNIGDACDDGNANTENDVVDADCNCAGTPVFDCPDLEANIGDACDDGDANTENDVVGDNCVCAGTPIVVLDCPELGLNIGDACDDGNDDTENDTVTEDCECVGTPIVVVPENDLCADAIAVQCGETVSGTTIGGTTDDDIQTCVTTLNTSPGVWYSFTGFDGIVSATTCSDIGAQYDTKLGVFSGICDDLVCVTGNDDAPANSTELDCNNEFGANRASYVEFEASADETYYIYVTGFSSNVGNFDLTVTCQVIDCESPVLALSNVDLAGDPIDGCLEAGSDFYVLAALSGGSGNATYNVSANGADAVVVDADGSFTFGPYTVGTNVSVNAVGADSDICFADANIDSPELCAPANDNCADAPLLACDESIQGSTIGASQSDFPSPDCANGTPNDVFYTLDAEPGTEYSVTVNGDDYDAVLVVYSGSCDALDGLIELGCSDLGLTSGVAETVVFTVDEAQTVIIRTYDWSSTAGSFTLDVSCQAAFDCPDLEANIGDACDDGDDMTENDTVGTDCQCVGTPIEFDCPDLEANFGDACNDGNDETGNDMITENCECVGTPIVVPDCENFMYYLADHAAADGISDIYGVTLSAGVATMSYIATSEIEVHIAFNEEDNNIYALSKFENSYRTLDPSTGVWGPTVMLGADYGEVTAAVFNADGKLVFGSQDNNAIYCVNVTTNVVSDYDTAAPVTGGDLAYTADGMLYLATRSGLGSLYEVYPDDVMPDVLIGSVPNLVTGMAATEMGDQLLVSAQGNMSLDLYNTDGSNAGVSYMLDLDGEPYTLRDGDMASGCDTREIVSDCDNYVTFYVNHGPDVDGSDLYTVDFVGGNAELTYVTNVDFEAHIGYNPEDGLMYFVNKDGSNIRIYNVLTDVFVGNLPILGGVDELTAVLYDSNDGELYVGDANSDVIASIDLGSGIASFYANAPVFGGDIAILNGTMYLARRNLNQLYEVVPFGDAVLLGDIPGGVNGMAPSPNPGNMVTSSAAQNTFVEISAVDGSTISTFPALLDGESFTFINGDMASGCIDNLPEVSFIGIESQSQLSAYPNPTSGPSQVVFMTGETGRTLVEVYDMNGRNVTTLFNQEAQKGQEYRLDFDGTYLPNGVYIYRLINNNETIIEKFMIAK